MAQIKVGMAGGFIRFATFTAPGNEDVMTSYQLATKRWKTLQLRMQRRWGKFEYLIVVEPQKRGHAHLHVLIRGQRFLPQRQLSQMAVESGFGRITDVRAGHPRLVGYLAKYLTKTLQLGPAQAPKYFRRVRMSRGWLVDEPAWEPAHRWTSWWILDAPPLAAALDARRHGYNVVEWEVDRWERETLLGRCIQWLRTVRGYRSRGFCRPAARPA
ncbi:MAG: hypothetical protein K5924_08750 [Chloroflexi bacterium]|nr:hypothetical protein [Chloroflexota bacterium]